MDEITKSAPAPTPPVSRTMSSLEIAKLTDKQHRNVLADIRKTLEEAGINAAEFSAAHPRSFAALRPTIGKGEIA